MASIIQQARVISQDPENYSVTVMFPSTQFPAIKVRVATQGPADGIRVKHPPLPTRGTWGLVVFPNDDDRNGVWIASLYVQQMNAMTTITDPSMDYHSHVSGYYSTLDRQGHMVLSFPDGSSLVVGSGTSKPATFRNVVNPQQVRVQTPFPDTERVPSPPSPFNVTFTHANGVSINISPAGLVTVSTGSGASILTMDAAGVVDMRGSQVNMGGLAETLYRLIDERAIATLNNHTHPDPQGGNTGPPNQTIAVGSATTTVTFAG